MKAGVKQRQVPGPAHACLWTDPQILLDAITDYAICELDPAGYVCSWNGAAQRLTGYRVEDIVGQHFSRFYTLEDVADGAPRRGLWTAQSEGKFADEGWRVRADGNRIRARVSISSVLNVDGSIKGYVQIIRDISAQHEAEQKLHEANLAIAKMEKMHALGRVAGGIAHDFNNLLTAIVTSVDHIKGKSEAVASSNAIAAIEAAANQAAQLTLQLLTFARSQPLRPARISLSKCVEDMMPVLRNVVRDNVSLLVRSPRDDCSADIDAAQFCAAITNLVTNANDAVKQGGTIVIEFDRVNEIPAIRKHAPVRGKYIAVSVIDNGPGIPAEIVDDVFEPFFTTKPLYHGTGLGLSQVLGFCKQSAGDVAITAGPEQGTTVSMYVPLAPSPAVIDDVALASTPAAGDPRGASILLVEDNTMIGASASSALAGLGYEVVWLQDGKAALDLLHQRRQSFDAIISDVEMPGISGLDLARELDVTFPHIPVLLTSGHMVEPDDIEYVGRKFVQKPYRLHDLVKFMDETVAAPKQPTDRSS